MNDSRETPHDPLYEKVARYVAQMIRKGTLKPGERIPSIRRMSNQMSVAISTVQHAYQLLEDRGLVEARPKSGYFVRPRHARRVADALGPLEPEMRKLPLKAGTAKVDDDEFLRVQSVGRQASIALGMSLPSPEFLPTDAINKHLSRVIRYEPASASRYELAPGLRDLRVRVAQRASDSCRMRFEGTFQTVHEQPIPRAAISCGSNCPNRSIPTHCTQT